MEIIAAIMVDETTSPRFPKIRINMKAEIFFISNPVMTIKRKQITIFNEKVRSKLKKSLPINILEAGLDNFRA